MHQTVARGAAMRRTRRVIGVLLLATVAALLATFIENWMDSFLPKSASWVFWDTFLWVALCTTAVAFAVTHSLDVRNQKLEQLSQMLSEKQWALQQAVENLNNRNTELAELNELKNTFIGMAAHDLRNPLAAIRLVAQILLDQNAAGNTDPAFQSQLLTRIQEAGVRMGVMLDNYLDNSRIEAGGFQRELRNTNVETWSRQVIESVLPLAAAKDIRVESTTTVGDATRCFDPDLLELAVTNLMTNAIKFSRKGSVVHVEFAGEGDTLAVRVTDQGPGLPANAENLFEKFHTGPARPQSGERSTGLGLYIVLKIAEVHGGTAQARNVPGGGSCFEIRIPDTLPQSLAQEAV